MSSESGLSKTECLIFRRPVSFMKKGDKDEYRKVRRILSVFLLIFAAPVRADVTLCGGLGGNCSKARTENCVILDEDGGRHTESCIIHSHIRGFLMPKPREVVYTIGSIALKKDGKETEHEVGNSPRFYADSTFRRSGKAEAAYLCFPDIRPNAAVCIDAANDAWRW